MDKSINLERSNNMCIDRKFTRNICFYTLFNKKKCICPQKNKKKSILFFKVKMNAVRDQKFSHHNTKTSRNMIVVYLKLNLFGWTTLVIPSISRNYSLLASCTKYKDYYVISKIFLDVPMHFFQKYTKPPYIF